MLPQYLAQGGLEQVGGGVITGRSTADSSGNGQIDRITDPDRPSLDMAMVNCQVNKGSAGFRNLQMGAAGRDDAAVTRLTGIAEEADKAS